MRLRWPHHLPRAKKKVSAIRRCVGTKIGVVISFYNFQFIIYNKMFLFIFIFFPLYFFVEYHQMCVRKQSFNLPENSLADFQKKKKKNVYTPYHTQIENKILFLYRLFRQVICILHCILQMVIELGKCV